MAFPQCRQRRVAELNRVDADHRVGAAITQADRGEVGRGEVRVVTVLARAAVPSSGVGTGSDGERYFREVHADEASGRTAGEFATVASASAGQVDQNAPMRQS